MLCKVKKIYRIKIKKNEFIKLEYSTNSVYVKFALTFDQIAFLPIDCDNKKFVV